MPQGPADSIIGALPQPRSGHVPWTRISRQKGDVHHNRSAMTTRRRDIQPTDGATFLQRPHPCAYETPDTVDKATADKKPMRVVTAKVWLLPALAVCRGSVWRFCLADPSAEVSR